VLIGPEAIGSRFFLVSKARRVLLRLLADAGDIQPARRACRVILIWIKRGFSCGQ
jgi:hypothetical protein